MDLQVLTSPKRKQQLESMVDNAVRASEFLKALSHETRLMILCLLSEKERSVGDLGKLLSLRQPAVSQHLARLRGDGLVTTRRLGKTICYKIASEEARVIVGAVYNMFCKKPRKR